jgi:putative ABC transport system permease protein
VEDTTTIGVFFVAFALFAGFVAGILPAWILSGYQPAKVIKGSIAPTGLGRAGLRKTLIVIQFAVAMGFIFTNGHLFNQFEYMATENDNFNRRNIVNIMLTGEKQAPLIDEFSRVGSIEKIGFTSSTFGNLAAEYALKASPTAENTVTWYYAADRNFVENMNLKIVAGQNLPLQSAADSAGRFVLINEKAVERLGLGTPREAVGKTAFLNNAEVLVAGVVQDFCHFNYQFRKEPLVLRSDPAQYRVMSVKTAEGISQDGLLAELNAIWKKHHPYREMVASWYDREMYERYYPAEDMKMMGAASGVILVIALMGLLGMIVFSVERRVREIGIRKVLGASIGEVMRILSWGFAKLLLLAGLIALPFGFFFGFVFQNLFTFHPALNTGLMLGLFTGVLALGLLAIAYFTRRAALANPVQSLRSE